MAVTVERTIAFVLKEAEVVLPVNGQQPSLTEVVLATPPEIGLLFARLGPVRIQQEGAGPNGEFTAEQLEPLLQSAVDELNATAEGRTYSLAEPSNSVYRPGIPYWVGSSGGGISAALQFVDSGGTTPQPLRSQLDANGVKYTIEFHLVADIP